jgi:hypothetical protein
MGLSCYLAVKPRMCRKLTTVDCYQRTRMLILCMPVQGMPGILDFLYTGNGFVEHQCRDLTLLPATHHSAHPTHTTAAAAAATGTGGVPVCWEDVSAAAAARSCHVISVRADISTHECSSSSRGGRDNSWGSSHNDGSYCAADLRCGIHSTVRREPQRQRQQEARQELYNCLATELAMAAAGCSVKLVTSTPVDLGPLRSPAAGAHAHDTAAAVSRISQVTAVLGVSPDPFAQPPQHTLDSLMGAEAGMQR